MSKKSKVTGLFDIPPEFPCPECGAKIKIELKQLNTGPKFVECPSCHKKHYITNKMSDEIFSQHSKRIGTLREKNN